MALQSAHRPPQTLKQAKRAFLKSGASHHLSEVEKRHLERAAELQKRADRIRDKEKRRKVNQKKKDEKSEREREARRKSGRPEVKEVYVSPHQCRLGAFLGVVVKYETEAKEEENSRIGGNHNQNAQKELSQPRQPNLDKPLGDHPSPRTPLQSISINTKSALRPRFLASPMKTFDENIVDWADFLVSNTQIARELSPGAESTISTYHSIVQMGKPMNVDDEDSNALLNTLVTQDLDSSYEDTPTAHKVTDPKAMFAIEITNVNSEGDRRNIHPAKLSRYDFKPTAATLSPPEASNVQNHLSKYPMVSKIGSHQNYENHKIKTTSKDSPRSAQAFNDDEKLEQSAPSSKELLDFTQEDAFGDFEISTQDLQDLVP